MSPPEENEIIVGESMLRSLRAVAGAEAKDLHKLIEIVEGDADSFQTFIADTGRHDDPHARQILAAMRDKARQPVAVSTLLQRPEELVDQSFHACVLFADLFGTTEFKLNHSESQAAKKVVHHNKITSDVIKENGGSVVKHVGDRVMGIFEGGDCEKQAVSTGIAIVEGLIEENRSQGLHFPDDLSNSIGIRSGRVWRVRYDDCGVEDYVGLPVDVAARLCSLAGLGQVICDEDTFRGIRTLAPNWSYSDSVERFVEGLDEPLAVRLVVPTGYPTEADLIRPSGFTRPIPQAAKGRLKEARKLYREKKFDDAFRLYQEVLGVDSGNFEANICCAEIELYRLNKADKNRFETLETIIHDYLCVAKQICPHSSRVWRLLGQAYYLQAIEKSSIPLLSTALKRATDALRYAQEYMDRNEEVEAGILLAEILREQGRLDKSSRTDSLTKANEHCAEVANQVGGFLSRMHSNHLAIQSLVQADLGMPLDKVAKMLEQARTTDPTNPKVLDALADFYRIHGEARQRMDDNFQGL